MRTSRFGRLACAVFFSVAGGCAAFADDDPKPSDPNPPATTKIEVARGDRWTYEVRDDITDELKSILDFAVTDVADSEIDTRARFTNVATNAESASVQVFDQNWRLKDNGGAIFKPAEDETGIPADVQLGKAWTYGFEMSRISPAAHFKFVGKAKVYAWERVTVANGLAFDAFKIVYNSAVTPVVNNRKWEVHVELWFAPAANRYVKRRYESRQNGKLVEASIETLRDYQRRAK
jgi:hypothetical protein